MLFHNAMYYTKCNGICQYLFQIFFSNFFILFLPVKKIKKGRQTGQKVLK